MVDHLPLETLLFVNTKKNLIVKYAHETVRPRTNLKNEFCNYFRDWMSSTHKFKGIEDYNIACFSQGTTESFNHFYLRFYK